MLSSVFLEDGLLWVKRVTFILIFHFIICNRIRKVPLTHVVRNVEPTMTYLDLNHYVLCYVMLNSWQHAIPFNTLYTQLLWWTALDLQSYNAYSRLSACISLKYILSLLPSTDIATSFSEETIWHCLIDTWFKHVFANKQYHQSTIQIYEIRNWNHDESRGLKGHSPYK